MTLEQFLAEELQDNEVIIITKDNKHDAVKICYRQQRSSGLFVDQHMFSCRHLRYTNGERIYPQLVNMKERLNGAKRGIDPTPQV